MTTETAKCMDCSLSRDDAGWIEVRIPSVVWAAIMEPAEGDHPLCITCMARRLSRKGFKGVSCDLLSGPLASAPSSDPLVTARECGLQFLEEPSNKARQKGERKAAMLQRFDELVAGGTDLVAAKYLVAAEYGVGRATVERARRVAGDIRDAAHRAKALAPKPYHPSIRPQRERLAARIAELLAAAPSMTAAAIHRIVVAESATMGWKGQVSARTIQRLMNSFGEQKS